MHDPLIDLPEEYREGKVEKRVPLEKDIEKAVCKYLQTKYGAMTEKFISPAKRSVPDRLISLNTGRVFFIEFKAPGKKPTALQNSDHEKRRSMRFIVLVIDDVERGKVLVDYAVRKLC